MPLIPEVERIKRWIKLEKYLNEAVMVTGLTRDQVKHYTIQFLEDDPLETDQDTLLGYILMRLKAAGKFPISAPN